MMIMTTTMVRCYLFLIMISEQCYQSISNTHASSPIPLCNMQEASYNHHIALLCLPTSNLWIPCTVWNSPCIYRWNNIFLWIAIQCKKTRTPVLEANTMPDKWLIRLHDVTFINHNKTFCEDWVNIQHWRNYLFSSWS
jgi:hypothetical protein